jgi:hypothetical protein
MQENFMSQSHAPRLPRAPWCAALAALLIAATAAAEELPTLKRGMWQFDRTVNGREMGVITQCANPTVDMKEQDAMLTAAGCNFAPVRQDGDTYSFDVECAIKSGSTVINSKTTTVMTVSGDSAYTVRVTGTTNGKPTEESVVAKRLGDCTK